MYCEAECKSAGSDGQAFNLCLWCFSNAFPEHHDHPRSSFATKVIVGPHGVHPVKGGIITRFEKDLLDQTYIEPAPLKPAISETGDSDWLGLDNDQGYLMTERWKTKKICVFCNDEGTDKDSFLGPLPFLMSSTNRYGETKRRSFWAHNNCARYSPEVIQAKDGTWFNVTTAMRRGRTVVGPFMSNSGFKLKLCLQAFLM